MSAAAGPVLSRLRGAVSGGGGLLFRGVGRTLNNARALALTSHVSAQSKKTSEDDEEQSNEPIKFSTSKASHRSWKVDRSLGSNFQRPWWKVLPLSVLLTGFILWCAFRDESDIDAQLEKQLYEHLPGLLSDEEEQQVQEKSTSQIQN